MVSLSGLLHLSLVFMTRRLPMHGALKKVRKWRHHRTRLRRCRFAEGHQGAAQAHADLAMQEVQDQEARWAAITYGMGLLRGWGFRQLHEVWMCPVGTILMQAATRILLWIYTYGGSISLERPKGDNEYPDKWSLWGSGFLKQLLLTADAQLTKIFQGPLGQNFVKPATIFSVRLPDLAQQIYSQYDLQRRPTEWLGGKSGGAWRAREAKVYPEKLCRAPAFSHMRHAESLCAAMDTAAFQSIWLQSLKLWVSSMIQMLRMPRALSCAQFFIETPCSKPPKRENRNTLSIYHRSLATTVFGWS